MRSPFRLLLATLFLTLVIPATTLAMTMGHGGIYTAKYVDGANLILLNINADEVESAVPIAYNLRLFDMTGQPIMFEEAQIRFVQDSKTVHDETVTMSDNQDAGLRYALPKQGTYSLHVRFLDHDKQISQAEFPVVAAKGPNQSFWVEAFSVQTGLAFVLGAGAAALYYKRDRLSQLQARLVKRKRK